jgi:hypothetical protein
LAIGSAHVLDWHGYVFRLHDLPLAIAANPCIRPNKATPASALACPRLTPLNYRRIAEKADVGIVQVIGKKIAWARLGVSDASSAEGRAAKRSLKRDATICRTQLRAPC